MELDILNIDDINELNIFEFILKYKNKFEKRKYFLIDNEYKIVTREPSFILELANIFFEREKIFSEELLKETEYKSEKKSKLKSEFENLLIDAINNEFKDTFVEKNKRIERLSKIEISKLKDAFRRAILNQEKVHTVKLGNELLHRSKKDFFSILYNISLISMDQNKLIKTYFTEHIINKITNLNKYREQVDEIIRNVINYFVKSENSYIDFFSENNFSSENNNSQKFFSENKADILYKAIYEKEYENLVEKYEIKNTKKIKFEKDTNLNYNELSESKKILYNYIIRK